MRKIYDKFMAPLGKVEIPISAVTQYNKINDEVAKLCELTEGDWGLIYDPWFNKVTNDFFIAGVICTVCVVGVTYGGYKIIKSRRSSQNLKEEG